MSSHLHKHRCQSSFAEFGVDGSQILFIPNRTAGADVRCHLLMVDLHSYSGHYCFFSFVAFVLFVFMPHIGVFRVATVYRFHGWLGSRVVGVLNSGAEGLGFKSQPRRCRVTVLGKLFTPVVPLFTKQQNWQQPS